MKHYSIYTNVIVILLALSLASCVGAPALAPAPVDGDVVGMLTGTTQWIISQASRNVPAVGTEVWYNAQKGLAVIATPFQEGYGFVIMDSQTLDIIDDPALAKDITGNYVNTKTYVDFQNWLAQNGWVMQLLVFCGNLSRSWYTFVFGTSIIPDSITIDGVEVPLNATEGIKQ